MENIENMIEFISGARTATVTFTNQKHVNRIKNYMKNVKMILNISKKIKMVQFVQNCLLNG